MNKKITFLVGLSLVLRSFTPSFAQSKINIEQYTLNNGLTIILNEDHSKAEVFGYMVCKAGGKDDPADATGMAHYMEHMLFKGTTQMGTTDWESEKIHIDSIFMLYNTLSETTDVDEKKNIQMQINEQSIKANEFAIPNEFATTIKKYGGTGLNANTSPDRTVYFNSFPPNQIETWLALYANRIQDAVFRGFQSELEVVYEEKNMYADMFFNNIIESFQQNFFKVHPYGQRNLIGTIDDLKNPSLNKMYEFYKTWYVPNNMALVLCGDFESDKVKIMIESAFGLWKQKEIPEREKWKEEPIKGRELVEVKMSPIKMGVLGFATVQKGHSDELALKVCNGILSSENGSGLLDQLTLNNELLAAQLFSLPYHDYGTTALFIVPKIVGQSLEEAEQLVLKKFEQVKTGDFENWRVDAVKKELYRMHLREMETNEFRGITIGEIFARDGDINDLLNFPEKIKSISKEDIITVANKYYGDNYLAFFSGMGSAKTEKIEKPGFKPVVSNTNAQSTFVKDLEKIKPLAYTPNYIDFDKDIAHVELRKGVDLYNVENPKNDIFSLSIRFKVGNQKIPMLKYATYIMDLAYTEAYNKEELKNEIAKIGASCIISSDDSYTTIEINGIESDLDRALSLINGLLNKPKLDQKDIDVILEIEKANRKIERSEPDDVAQAAIDNIRYGNQSDFLTRLTLNEIKALKIDELLAAFTEATQHEVELHYTGQKSMNELKQAISQNLKFNAELKAGNKPAYKEVNVYTKNTVFFINKKKAIQSKIFFFMNAKEITLSETPKVEAFNQYFGGGFSGLVLQEIREYRSLAYSSGAIFKLANQQNKPPYFIGYIGTQADKTAEALSVFMGLIRDMPQKEDRMEFIRPYLEQSTLAERPDFRNLSTYVMELKHKGFNQDPALLFKPQYANLTFNDIETFYNENIKTNPMVITIVGDKKQLDYKGLSQYGTIIELKEKDLFRD